MKVKIQMLELEVEGEGVAEVVAAALGKFLEQSNPMQAMTPDVASVACPRCGAGVGKLCTHADGGFYPSTAHAERAVASLGKGSSRT